MTVSATPYTCSVCGVAKKETNHWYVVVISSGCAAIYTWLQAESLSIFDSARAEHLCGQLCVHKLIDRLFFNKIQEADSELRKQNQEVVEPGV